MLAGQRDYEVRSSEGEKTVALVRGLGTGQIRRKVKEDEIGIGITDAGSLSLKAGEGAGVANK